MLVFFFVRQILSLIGSVRLHTRLTSLLVPIILVVKGLDARLTDEITCRSLLSREEVLTWRLMRFLNRSKTLEVFIRFKRLLRSGGRTHFRENRNASVCNETRISAWLAG